MKLNFSCFFFFLIFFSGFLYSQEKIQLTSYLEILKQKFSTDFNYIDEQLETHFVVPKTTKNIDLTLKYLNNNTLFSFQLLNDNSVTVTLKQNLNIACAYLKSANNNIAENVIIATPYQIIEVNSNGYFEVLYLNSNNNISINSLTFEDIELPIGTFSKNPCITYFLNEKIETLTPVLLQNYLAKGISKNIDGSLTINYNNFDILPGLIEPDVLLTAQALPGIQSVNETISYLNIRGGTNDQNLILWEGIKMYQNSHFFGLISAFNNKLITDVTLTKNGTSATLGDGVSGVIDMKGKDEVVSSFNASAGINLLSADATVDLPISKIASLQLSARTALPELINSPTYRAYFDRAFQNTEVTSMGGAVSASNDKFSFFDTALRGVIKPSKKDLIRFNFIYLQNNLSFLENASLNNTLQSLESTLNQNNFSGGIFYKRKWNEAFSSQIQFYGSNYNLEATNSNILNVQTLEQENSIIETGININNHYELNKKLNFKIGYQLNETGITNAELINNPFFQRSDKQVLITQSGWLETNFLPNQKTTLTGGLRVNHVNKFNKWLVEPRLQVSHQLSKAFTLEVLGEIKSQTTSQIIDFQEDFLGVENRRWVLANPGNIPIIRSKQFSTGFTYNKKGWLLSVEPYVKEIEGISSRSQGFLNQFEDEIAFGDYTVLGVDFLLNKRFKKVNTWLSYSYAENNYFFEAFSPQNFPNNIDVRHTLTCGINYSANPFNIAAGLNWHSGIPTTLINNPNVIDNNINFATANASNISNYFRVDVSATYKFKLSNKVEGYIGASIWNLFNRTNIVNHFFRINAENEVQEIDEIALKFTPNFSFRLNF